MAGEMGAPFTMDFYQQFTATTDVYPNECKPWVYALGLAGETGEVADKLKKMYRDSNGVMTDEQKKEVLKELGDVLWYLTRLSASFGFTLNDVAWENFGKLNSRKQRGCLHGSGDNR